MGARALVGTRYLDDPALRAQYARDIAPRTEIVLARVLAEVYGPLGVPAPTRALDLGAGTGAVGRVLRARFGAGLEITEVDRVPSMPGVVRADLAREIPSGAGRFDLLVAAHLLNELYVDRPEGDRVAARADRVGRWAEALLAPGGAIILIEPALRETSRELLAVRDRIAGGDPQRGLHGGLHILAPCFWTGPCPALARDRDWCHDAAPAPSAPRVDFSYLVLRLGMAESPSPPSRFRVVSDPLPEKGRLRLFGCGASGRHAFVRLDRHAAESNAAFAEAKRGEVLDLEHVVPAGDGLRVTAESKVSSTKP